MLNINVNPEDLTQAQREHVAAFILSYPTATAKLTPDVRELMEPTAKTSDSSLAAYPQDVMSDDDAVELLTRDQESDDPTIAFGNTDEAAAAFGTPLASGEPAPFTAGAVPSETAHAGSADTSAPTNVPPPPVATPGSMGETVAPNTASPAASVELDAAGLPWDARIHSRGKTKVAAGTWTAKRGVDPSTVARVEVELRQVMGAPATSASVTVPAVPVAPGVAVVELPGNVGGGGGGGGGPGQVTDPDAPRKAFIGLVGRTSAAMNAGKITQAEIAQICSAAGVAALPLLANRLDLVGHIAQQIDALIATRG